MQKQGVLIRESFYEAIHDLIHSPYVQAMRDIPQHSPLASRFEHSLYVAYISYKICKKLGLDARAAARGGLLHDFEIGAEISRGTHPFKMFFMHPKVAVVHARQTFDLTKKECDIIAKHMWPATPLSVPRYKESLVVCMVDTYCAAVELFGGFKKVQYLESIE